MNPKTSKKAVKPERRFVEMNGREKAAFLGKALVFFLSGGFVYPTLWID